MRELNLQEAARVAGGNDTVDDGVENACLVQPDISNVTVTYQSPESGVTLTAKCVDYLRTLDSGGSGPEPGL